MRKTIIILISLFMLSGCYDFNMNDKNQIYNEINNIIVNNNTHSNVAGKGFKYYKPRDFSVSIIDTFNHVLTHEGDKYYLSVDINAYYDKIKPTYEINENIYYSNTFSNDNLYGYVEVEQINDYFYIKMMYNYSYMEVRVLESDINEAIINSLIILDSIEYNDKVISKYISNGNSNEEESVYELENPNIKTNNNILDYVE